jgi:cytoskeletal protein CcmA (bactofilin family)
MAIFGKVKKSASNPLNTTIISDSTKIRGQIQGECMVHMNGKFSGPIHSKSIISVGRSGFIEGDVTAKKLIVTGRLLGTADCEEIQILAGGEIIGQITCKILVIERGGFLQGQNKHKESAAGISKRPSDESPIRTMNNTPNNVARISEAPEIVNNGQANLII